MNIQLDSDVQAVAEFMQANIPAARLVAVAEAMASLAPTFWGHFERECIIPAKLVAPAISLDDQHRLLTSTEHHLAQ